MQLDGMARELSAASGRNGWKADISERRNLYQLALLGERWHPRGKSWARPQPAGECAERSDPEVTAKRPAGTARRGPDLSPKTPLSLRSVE